MIFSRVIVLTIFTTVSIGGCASRHYGSNRSVASPSIKSMTNKHVCSVAITTLEGKYVWDKGYSFLASYSNEAKRRGFTPEQCARISGNTAYTGLSALEPTLANMSSKSICLLAGTLSEGRFIWESRSQFQRHVEEARKRNFTPEQCVKLLERPAEVEQDVTPPVQNADEHEAFPVASGSGFAVSSVGHVVTNNHVVDGCSSVVIHDNGKTIKSTILYRDRINDLALLKGDFTPSKVFSISRRNPEIMQEVYVSGYPFGTRISSTVKVTKGIVSSLTGIENNVSNMQIDAALQPGNSGGPIFDKKGNVIGVAVAKLDLKKVVADWGVVPENTNFGIKSNVVVNMLESNNINVQEASGKSIANTELGEIMSNATYYLSCWMTMAQAKKMAVSKVMFGDLLQ